MSRGYPSAQGQAEVCVAGLWSKVREQLEWAHHGKLLLEVLLSLGAGQAVRALLKTAATKVPDVWITPLWIFATAIILAVFVYFNSRRTVQKVLQQSSNQSALTVTSGIDAELKALDKMYHRIEPSFSGEIETAIRAQIGRLPTAQNRENFLSKGTHSWVHIRPIRAGLEYNFC
jgi:hypothetical protein